MGIHKFPKHPYVLPPPPPLSNICAVFLLFLQQWLSSSSRPAKFIRRALSDILPCHPSFSWSPDISLWTTAWEWIPTSLVSAISRISMMSCYSTFGFRQFIKIFNSIILTALLYPMSCTLVFCYRWTNLHSVCPWKSCLWIWGYSIALWHQLSWVQEMLWFCCLFVFFVVVRVGVMLFQSFLHPRLKWNFG